MEKTISKNKIKHWFLASRPKTLIAGITPVIVGSALAFYFDCFNLVPAILCFFFAVFCQIATNLTNDYFDFKKGTDTQERIGPERALNEGWLSSDSMRHGIIISILIAICIGLGLIKYGGYGMILVGIFCIIFLLAYTAGPWPLSYHAMGDIAVIVFFGFVAVFFTYFVQFYSQFSELTAIDKDYFFNHFLIILPYGLAVGLITNNILLVNNYRDSETDKKNNKKTTVILFGDRFALNTYLFNGFFATIINVFFAIAFKEFFFLLNLIYLIPHILTWKEMINMPKSKDLNKILGKTARNLFIYGILTALGLILSTIV